MNRNIRYGVLFPGKDIEAVWGKPVFSERIPDLFVPVFSAEENDLKPLLGLRVYGKITGYSRTDKRETLTVSLLNGNRFFRRAARTNAELHCLVISERQGDAAEDSGARTGLRNELRRRPCFLHGVLGAEINGIFKEEPDPEDGQADKFGPG